MIHQTGLLQNNLAILENNGVRNAPHVVSLRKNGRAFRVYLQDDGSARHLRGYLFDFRRSHSTGAAPCGPEIDENRDASFAHNAVEILGVCLDWFCNRWKLCLAGTAPPGVCHMLGRHAVALSTDGAF